MHKEERKKRFLIMDDEEMVGEIACQMLEYLGYDAIWVKNGEDAIEKYRHGMMNGDGFDAVIMDLTIPAGMGGKEAVIEILGMDRAAKVFVSSGYSNDPIMVNYQHYGFVGVIAKPFDLEAVQQLLDAVV